MYTATQLIDAARTLYPNRLHADEKPSADRSLLLAAVVDFQAHNMGPYVAAMDLGKGVLHPAYHTATAALFFAKTTLRETSFPTETHRAQAELRGAREMVERKLRGMKPEDAKFVFEAAASA